MKKRIVIEIECADDGVHCGLCSFEDNGECEFNGGLIRDKEQRAYFRHPACVEAEVKDESR